MNTADTDVPEHPAHVDSNWSGVNHLALITNDMDATVRFWHCAMGAPLVATVRTDAFRHYFFDVGGSTVAFFEYDGRETDALAKPAGIFDPRAGHFDHLSLNLPDRAAVIDLRKRLLDHGCDVTELVDHGLMESIYFTDPNGIAMEASYWLDDPTGETPRLDDSARFADEDPVAAVRELMRDELESVPATALVEEPGDSYLVGRS